jgi:hypothetical protein
VSFHSKRDVIVDWRRAIAELIAIQQHIRDLDRERTWAHELPQVAATPAAISEVERHLGTALDGRFRSFLLYADGWRAFYEWIDLFGTHELLGPSMALANGRLEELERTHVLAQSKVERSSALPIGMTRPDHGTPAPDLFVLFRDDAVHDAQVVWLADEEVDRFASFDSFYLAMLDYNREEIRDLAGEAPSM